MKRSRCWLRALGLVVAFACLGSSRPAAANGRFPRAQRLLEAPYDPSRLILSGTYGLLFTSDRGRTWYHGCEASFGVTDLPIDPLVALSPDGTLFAGLYSSVARSTGSGCDFRKTLGMSNREAVPDFTLVAGEPGQLLAALVKLLPDGSLQNQLYRSSDDGLTWTATGAVLPASLQLLLTLEVAPSSPQRVYVSGLGPERQGVLLRSDDGAESFQAFELPTDSALDEMPYIVAVPAGDPDTVYLRTDVWAYDALDGTATADDALLYTNDGGESFTELLRASGKLFGFTFSPDGSEVLVGYGDPREVGGGRVTNPDSLGIYRAPSGSADFVKRYAGAIGCLTWTEEGLYVCTHESDTGFSLGLIRETDFELAASPGFEPLLRLKDVAGPLPCAACSSGAICQSYWPSTCQSWGRSDCESLPAPMMDCSTGGAPEQALAGAGGAEGSAEPGAGATSAGRVASESELSPRGSGCACRSSSGKPAPRGLLLASLLLLLRRRSRRRRERPSAAQRQ